MKFDYQDKLFNSYSYTHVDFVKTDPNISESLKWFDQYYKVAYKSILKEYLSERNPKILEIGCNRGFLLSSLYQDGFTNIYGIDLSNDDLEIARKIVPQANLSCINAFEYLNKHNDFFDLIILKAVLEHIEKESILKLMNLINKSLKYNGLVIIDVPNMDWLFASHERYMDFTHEVGFTEQSLGQIMRNIFSDVDIRAVDSIFPTTRRDNVKQKISRFILSKLLEWADPQGGSNSIWCRNLVGFGVKKQISLS